MKRIPRRIFTAEFKREAIKLVTEQGLTFAEASKKLDIATISLRYMPVHRPFGIFTLFLIQSNLVVY